jgi:dihydroorotate dehydrogenase (fumarate)
MGFDLPHPLFPGASPLADDMDTARRLEDAGAPLLVAHSLFEEEIVEREAAYVRARDLSSDSFAEATSFLPNTPGFTTGPQEYLNHVARLKRSVSIPVIASLNGTTEGGWLKYAQLIAQAGADGLELNLYELASDPAEPGEAVERRALAIVQRVKASVSIPVAVKLSPFYSSIANFAHRLADLKVDGIVLFNRFYQPDIDVEQLEVFRVNLSSSTDLLLRLRWLALLFGRVRAPLAVTGGVHTVLDALKAVMAGAHAVQLVSALLIRGPNHLKELRAGMERWMEEHGYESLAQMRGSMSLSRCSDPKAYERANYMRLLQTGYTS